MKTIKSTMLGVKKQIQQVLVGVPKVLVEVEEVLEVGLGEGNVDELVGSCKNFIH